MSSIVVGTSGYSYAEWVGPVYPEGTRSEDFLTLYASLFTSVELNFSYYKMPSASQLSRLAEQTGPDFLFSIKAHESLTHKVDPSAWKDDARTFREALEPLLASGKLGAVLFQFPYSFHYIPERRRYLGSLLAEFGELPAAVEFRNHEWYNNRVLDALRERRVTLSSLDLPPLPGLPPVMDVVTSKLAYIRFHGRNTATWWGSDSASRYDYLYSDEELETWSDRVKGIAASADRVLVYFNNHRRGQAVRNAQSFISILSRLGPAA